MAGAERVLKRHRYIRSHGRLAAEARPVKEVGARTPRLADLKIGHYEIRGRALVRATGRMERRSSGLVAAG